MNVTPGFSVGSGTIQIGGDPPLNYNDFAAVNVTNAADQPLTAVDQSVVTTTGDPAVEGKALPYLVATFTDNDPNARTANFVATINWGDGTPTTAGTVVADGFARFDITATHTYLDDGTFPVVTITDTGTTGSYFFGGIPVTISDIGGSAVTTGTVTTTDLVSDGTVSTSAPNTDPNLVNPWGIAHSPTGPNWVTDNGTGVATLYNGSGQPSPLVVTIPPPAGKTGPSTPTGIVFHSTPGFVVSSGGAGGPASFLFATQDGTISGWNPNVPPGPTTPSNRAILAVDNSASGTVYTGLAIAGSGSSALLYAANFHSGKVDVFLESFTQLSTPGEFVDPTLPIGYAPHGIQAIGSTIVVTYARPDPTGRDALAGLGYGYADTFSTSGVLLKHLISNTPLNAPWGVAPAPGNFGQFSGDLLVADHGDGTLLGTTTLSSSGGYVQLSLTSASGIASVRLTETSGDILFVYDNLSFTTIPEPSSLPSLGLGGLISAGYFTRRGRRSRSSADPSDS